MKKIIPFDPGDESDAMRRRIERLMPVAKRAFKSLVANKLDAEDSVMVVAIMAGSIAAETTDPASALSMIGDQAGLFAELFTKIPCTKIP